MHYLRGRILKSNILSNKVLPFHNGTSTTEGPSPYHPRRLKKKPTNKNVFFHTYPLIQMNNFDAHPLTLYSNEEMIKTN